MSGYTTPGAARATHRRSGRYRKANLWGLLARGLLISIGATLICVLVFALLMQWLRPAEGVVRIINQVLKLLSIGVGVYIAVGRGCEGGLIEGALVGLLYMAVGVGVYALLSGQELIGVTNIEALKETVRKPEEDFLGFEGPVETWLPMTTEDILIVFPEDIHKVKVIHGESTLVQKACFKFKV